MAPEVLGIADEAVSERTVSTAAFSFSGVETSGTGRPPSPHTNTDARERYAAHRREVAGFVVIVHRRHGEDDGVERLRRELLSMSNGGRMVKVTSTAVRPPDSAAMAFAAICVDPTLRSMHLCSGGEGR